MNLQESIRRILREELNSSVRRRLNFDKIDKVINSKKIGNYKKNEPIENSIVATIHMTMYEIMPREYDDEDTVEYYKVWDAIKAYLNDKYSEELRQYFEKRQRDADEDKNPLGIRYIFVKHDKPYYVSGWGGFAEGFDSFDDMVTKYGDWVDVDWDEIKKKLDNINDYPDNTFTGKYKSRPLKLISIGDEGNRWGYNFSVVKSIPSDKTWDGDEDEIKKIESADLQYPILIFVDNGGKFISIIDGHHRAQKAVRKGLETIKAKVIPINLLPKDIRKVFSHMGKQEEMKEGELIERCWTGYTQKGMKTMFGKRYPNCVKIKKKKG